MPDFKSVSMKLPMNTIGKIDSIVELRGVRNKTQIVMQAIDIYYELAKAINEDADVGITFQDGSSVKLLIV